MPKRGPCCSPIRTQNIQILFVMSSCWAADVAGCPAGRDARSKLIVAIFDSKDNLRWPIDRLEDRTCLMCN